ncbi:MAG: glycoside hydrolase family 5 protein [Kiritimatiellaeota bacterium]|nr:glycoside hydrolase family 5 protein [Kiritimatiellota bacterium]
MSTRSEPCPSFSPGAVETLKTVSCLDRCLRRLGNDPLLFALLRTPVAGRSVGVTVLAFVLAGGPAGAVRPEFFASPVETFLPVLPGGRGGGVAAFRGTSAEKTVRERRIAGLRLHAEKKAVQATWWFPRHRPLRLRAWSSDRTLRLHIRVRGEKAGDAALTVRWRRADRAPCVPVKQTMRLASGAWTDLRMPLPPGPTEAALDGITLAFEPAGIYELERLEVVSLRRIRWDRVDPHAFFDQDRAVLSGRAGKGISNVVVEVSAAPEDGGGPIAKRTVPTAADGTFQAEFRRGDLEAGRACRFTAKAPGAHVAADTSLPVRLFVFPARTGKMLPPLRAQGRRLLQGNRPFGFVGFNYNGFNLSFSRDTGDVYERIARDVATLASWQLRVVRLPMNMGFVQPEPGVFPDDSRWTEAFRERGLNVEWLQALDYFVELAGEHGIYSVIDWHGFPVDPKRWQTGGMAWLCKDPEQRGQFDPANPRHVAALLATHAWMARHFRGNPNIMGFEVPYNEPHRRWMSVEANWRRITAACARAVKHEDPNRLTFAISASWGHENCTASSTWLAAGDADGLAPHFYLANGPVPLRPDAESRQQPWLCRDVDATFGWSLAAVLLPFSSVERPMYNGEGGEHGWQALLPDLDRREATSLMIEAGLVQYYAAGMAGSLHWSLWGHPQVFAPVRDIYARLYRRFAPVYAAGPVDTSTAQVVFIQNPAAIPTANGHNLACVPIARLVLQLHLAPVRYLTDDQVIDTGLIRMSIGTEQVREAAEALTAKALVVDRRNLDARVERMLRNVRTVPVLWTDDPATLSPDELAAFLERAGVFVDRRTPADIQIVRGPQHLVLYRRAGDGAREVRVFPRLRREGPVQLQDEDGRAVFEGSRDELARNGFTVRLPKWRSRIYRVRRTRKPSGE